MRHKKKRVGYTLSRVTLVMVMALFAVTTVTVALLGDLDGDAAAPCTIKVFIR